MRPSALVLSAFRLFHCAPWRMNNSSAIAAPGLPFAVSRTCVVSLPIDDFLQARARDVADLLHRVGELGRAIVMEPPLHLGEHALALRMQAQRDDAGNRIFAVAAVELGHFGELGLRKR